MDLKYFTQLLKNNHHEHNHYETVFNLLKHSDSFLSNDDREELFSIIYDYQFFNYSYTWHINNNEDFLNNLKDLNFFHLNNDCLHNKEEYKLFIIKNLFPIIEEELKYFYDKGSMIYSQYDDDDEYSRSITINFFSPIGITNFFKQNNLFESLNENIFNLLTTYENNQLKTENPIIKKGINILSESLTNKESFIQFLEYWNTYKKMLLPSTSVEVDLDIISSVAPEMHTEYCNYITNPKIHYEFEKSILSKYMTQFFFEHFEEFVKYKGKIPNPLVWIYESRHFLSTQNFIDNIEEKHFEYFKDFNHSSFFEKFITDILFSQRFNNDISYPKIKNILSKNFNFENLFQNFKINNPEIDSLSNFENYILKLQENNKKQDLLPFYRTVQLEHRLKTKNTSKRNHKI